MIGNLIKTFKRTSRALAAAKIYSKRMKIADGDVDMWSDAEMKGNVNNQWL